MQAVDRELEDLENQDDIDASLLEGLRGKNSSSRSRARPVHTIDGHGALRVDRVATFVMSKEKWVEVEQAVCSPSPSISLSTRRVDTRPRTSRRLDSYSKLRPRSTKRGNWRKGLKKRGKNRLSKCGSPADPRRDIALNSLTYPEQLHRMPQGQLRLDFRRSTQARTPELLSGARTELSSRRRFSR